MPSPHNFNSNHNNVQSTGIFSPSSSLSGIFSSARSYSVGVLHQILVDRTEQFNSHQRTDTDLREPYLTHSKEQPDPQQILTVAANHVKSR